METERYGEGKVRQHPFSFWRGGGTIFGPQPRDYSYKLPKKVRRLALMSAFHEKLSNGEVIIIDDFSLEKPQNKGYDLNPEEPRSYRTKVC